MISNLTLARPSLWLRATRDWGKSFWMVLPDHSVLPKTLSEEFTRLSLKKVFFKKIRIFPKTKVVMCFFVIKEFKPKCYKKCSNFPGHRPFSAFCCYWIRFCVLGRNRWKEIKELQKNIMKDANDSKHCQEVVLQKLNFVNIILTGWVIKLDTMFLKTRMTKGMSIF